MQYLAEQQVDTSCVVGITLSNEPDHLTIILALMGLGASYIALPTHDNVSIRQKLAERVGVTHVITHDSHDFADIHTIGYSKDNLPYEIQTRPKKTGESTVFLRTSGTTGEVKITPLLESQLISQADRSSDEFANQAFLRLASIEHDSAKRHRLYCIWNGGINVFRSNDNINIISYVREKEVTSVGLSRMQITSLLGQSEIEKLSSIEMHIGGSSVPYKLRAAIENLITKKLYIRYGTSEFGFISIANPGDHDADETSGRVLDGVELEIVDQNDNPLPKGSKGHIRVRGEGMSSGYHNSIEQSSRSFKNGWFYPGDLGYIRSDDQLVVLGRADDMIILDTINIYPAEIEKVLEAHAGIKTAIAMPIESDTFGQIPVAAVELHPQENIDSRDLLIYCREKLGIRSPKKILISPELPRSANGKINNALIKQMFKVNG
jgi:acyl-CoA synthetase (AMP-forming)/AMP-acid ligase II